VDILGNLEMHRALFGLRSLAVESRHVKLTKTPRGSETSLCPGGTPRLTQGKQSSSKHPNVLQHFRRPEKTSVSVQPRSASERRVTVWSHRCIGDC
jgi:hypothetical protein